MELLRPDACGLARAVRLLRGGGVIGFPTDTVYGLAALASDRRALERIYEAKGRPAGRPLILMVAEATRLDGWAAVDERARGYMARWWPGPLTLVLPAREGIGPPLTTAAEPRTIAARIPDHPVALALLREAAAPLATTSANRSGAPSALTAADACLAGLAAVLDGGRSPGGIPSTLLDLTGIDPRILREGPVTP